MIVLDTSIWIEFFKQNPSYHLVVKDLLERQKVLAIDCIFGELLQGARDKRERDLLIEYWINLPKSNTENIWIEAGKFSSEKKILLLKPFQK